MLVVSAPLPTPHRFMTAMPAHNRFFKRPDASHFRPDRSPSPPRRYVEPISPHEKPAPIEPTYNYPPINDLINFTVRPEQGFSTVTPRAAKHGTSTKSKHHRTPSTIDTLAEVALAASPTYHVSSHRQLPHDNFHVQNHTHGDDLPSSHGGGEPPHKRARSELLPSSHLGQYGSRPATSYEPANGWYQGNGQPQYTGHAYDSRVEEAALLLNFRTGGWPNNNSSLLPPPTADSIPIAARPHANSFPRAAHPPRPLEQIAQAPLLPPFSPQDEGLPPRTLPSPQQTIDDPAPSPKTGPRGPGVQTKSELIGETATLTDPDVIMEDVPQQTQTPPDEVDSRAPSADVAPSEVSEGPVKTKRGWPKGKPRNGRKTLSEKAAKGRASRRKTPDAARLGKKTRTRSSEDSTLTAQLPAARRKSFQGLGSERMYPIGTSTVRAKSVPPDTPMVIRPISASKTARRPKQVRSDTVCAGCALTRETSHLNGELDEWISCNGCKKWYHVDCAGFKKAHEVRDVDKYFCSACEPEHGKTTYVRKSSRAHASVDYAELQRGVLKTSEESNEHHYIQPIKDGTFQFDPEHFPRVPPELVTKEFLERSNLFVEPICIPAALNPRPWIPTRPAHKDNPADMTVNRGIEKTSDMMPEDFEYDAASDHGQDKLDMVMPEELTVRQVCNLVGPDVPLDVIDVKTQNSGSKWTLGRWADYYDEDSDDKPIRNVISLEVSQTKLGRMLRRPKVVRDIDLQDEVWPQKETDQGKYPKVQFYCLMSVADSYTDFHIDFGGSSVYYHILRGKKTFFFIPPKPKYLKAYEEWNDSPQQNYTFLPSITKECYRVDLSEGDTMLIPSGWIHAVWTPETSLVIGGNFLNRMSFKNQFKVVEIEKANETPMKFRYPFFQRIMWYTAIKYLQDDPLPQHVSQLFYEGQRFERQTPIWADFDGEIAANDPRPGARNARYYSHAEVDGLPDLVQFIFRTVMIVKGCVEGVTQDRIKRVYASIPKGYGEPLEVAKTFALWVAWKRGNEDIPAWAHPDAVLPNSKEEGPAKKLSQRALRDMERKEAIAAYRVAPDRQSARIKNTTTTTAAGPALNGDVVATTPERDLSNQPTHPTDSSQIHPAAGMPIPAMLATPPMSFVMNGMAGHHLSTPKTSVLGPKRVACDVCRKRRIKCKHKDLVTQVTPSQLPPPNSSDVMHSSQPAIDFYENITVSPSNPGQPPMQLANGHAASPNGGTILPNGDNPLPGTNAYVNANIPMTINGVPMFGDAPKRGRSKACLECRRSKRRCVHDENGNVDPVKAAESPVPRGTMTSKKRPFESDDSPLQPGKKSKTEFGDDMHHLPVFSPHGQVDGPQYHPQAHTDLNAPGVISNQHTHQSNPPPDEDKHAGRNQPPIDPELFSVYPEPTDNGPYTHSYPYPTNDRPNPYTLPSLEQIASEVLDMNGNSHEDRQDPRHHPAHGRQDPQLDALPNGHHYGQKDNLSLPNVFPPNPYTQPEESVDSAISLPATETSHQDAPLAPAEEKPLTNGTEPSTNVDATKEKYQPVQDEMPIINSTENTNPIASTMSDVQDLPSAVSSSINDEMSSKLRQDEGTGLPLYQPPAPVSQSPEQSRRPPHLTNGASPVPTRVAAPPPSNHKRKRNSGSDTSPPKAGKKARVSAGPDLPVAPHAKRTGSKEPAAQESAEDRESLELARQLQQGDLGLRRRN